MSGKSFQLKLFGAVELRSPSGQVVTPRLRKARALLAYLALSSERSIERTALQRLLWSDRMPRQARDSLKQALSDIRRAFAEADQQPLRSDGGPVQLLLGDIKVDALETPPANAPQLLEGIAVHDRPFMDWLIKMRGQRKKVALVTALDTAAPATEIMFRRFAVEILPIALDDRGATAAKVGAIVLDGFARALDQTGLFETFDRRLGSGAPSSAASEPDLCLTCNTLEMDGLALLSLAVRRADNGATIWSTTETVNLPMREPARLYRMAAHCVQQIGDAVWQQGDSFSQAHSQAADAMRAIGHISRPTPSNIAEAELTLTRAADALQTSALYAWRAYLTAYQLEKNGRQGLEELRECARYYSARALEKDRSNPLTCALVAHAHSFVLRDHARAHEILAPVRGRVGECAMLADTVGLVHFYSGRFDEACAHARLASDLGRWSPMRYAFTTLLSASQMMLGDLDGAIKSGHRALAQHPAGLDFQYEPTLRTLAAACALADRREEGQAAMSALEKQTGKSMADTMKEMPKTVYPNADVFRLIQQGIGKLSA